MIYYNEMKKGGALEVLPFLKNNLKKYKFKRLKFILLIKVMIKHQIF